MESELFDYEPMYCPEAVASWYSYKPGRKDLLVGSVAEVKLNAKKHLSYVGWRFRYVVKSSGLRELRYISPKGRCYYSLKTACKACILKEVSGENCFVVSKKEPSQCVLVSDGGGAKRKRRVCVDDSLSQAEMKKKKVKHRRRDYKPDFVCSVCHDVGDLVMCDACPSGFHCDCLGLDRVSDNPWYCPSCRCKICHQFKFGEPEIVCEQCNFNYHVACLRDKDRIDSMRDLEGNWFCSNSCKAIYAALNSLVAKEIVVGDRDDLTWTLLKPSSDGCHLEKLTDAFEVLSSCFDPIIDSYTGRELIEDVISNTKCDLRRLNCHGFYTVILEKDDHIVSVATLRVFGEKVAELPLVGTRFDYQGRGMCRKLMDELENRLTKMGVKKLILPACDEALNTWTNGFGFSKVTIPGNELLRDYTFLGFQDSTVCQKLLN